MTEIRYENGCASVLFENKKTVSIFDDGFCILKVNPTFKMSHGSFSIKQNETQKIKLNVSSFEQNENELTLHFDFGEKTGDVKFSVLKDKNILKIQPLFNDEYNAFEFSISSEKDEGFYGCGEIFSEFNLKGLAVNSWVAEHINAKQIAKKLVSLAFGHASPDKKQPFEKYETYYAQPTFLSSKKYFVHCKTTDFAKFDFTDDNKTSIRINDTKSEVLLGLGADFEDVMFNLTSIIGRQPMLPDWVFDGSILGIQGGTDVMMKKVESAQKVGAKINGVWIQDWEGRRVTAVGKQLMWNWEYDQSLYHDLPSKIEELNAKDIKVLGYINPFLATEGELYKYAAKNSFCVKDKDGKDYLVKITTFPAAMVDFTNPKAYEWIKSVIKENMLRIGLSGWMADFGEYLPTDCVLYSKEDAKTLHNTWPALWAQVNREALEETGNIGKAFFFTRSGYTGTVKNSTMMWNGDQHVDWSIDFGLPSVITATLGLCCSGFGFCHSDIGGYTTFMKLKRSGELFMRWCEMNCFSPLMRSHEGLNPDVNAQFDFDETVANHHAKMSKIHAYLKPYLKEIANENAEKGLGMIRPLFFYYKGFENENTEYLLGDDLLVAPIIKEGAKSRSVAFPSEEWVSIWNDKEYSNTKADVSCEFGFPAVFYKKGSKYSKLFDEIKNIK